MRISKSVYSYFIITAATFFLASKSFSQIEFIENKGQWNSEVKFMSLAGSGSFYLQKNGFTVAQHDPSDVEAFKAKRHGELSVTDVKKGLGDRVRSHAYTVNFINAQDPQIIPDKAIPTINNYFIGNDKSKWATDCRIYKGVTYKNVYPGIDVRYYSDAGSNLKYDFIIHPGADVNKIAMKYTGANKISVRNKELVVSTTLGDNKELSPYTYQVIENKRQELDCRYVIDGDVVKFKVKNYSPDKTLIIDPRKFSLAIPAAQPITGALLQLMVPTAVFMGEVLLGKMDFLRQQDPMIIHLTGHLIFQLLNSHLMAVTGYMLHISGAALKISLIV